MRDNFWRVVASPFTSRGPSTQQPATGLVLFSFLPGLTVNHNQASIYCVTIQRPTHRQGPPFSAVSLMGERGVEGRIEVADRCRLQICNILNNEDVSKLSIRAPDQQCGTARLWLYSSHNQTQSFFTTCRAAQPAVIPCTCQDNARREKYFVILFLPIIVQRIKRHFQPSDCEIFENLRFQLQLTLAYSLNVLRATNVS